MKRKLLYTILVLAILTAGIFFAFKTIPQSIYQPVQGALLDEASNTAASMLTDQLTSIRSSLLKVSADLGANNTICAHINSDFAQLNGKADGIFEINASNKIACSTHPEFVGVDTSELNNFPEFLKDPKHYPAVSHMISINSSPKLLAGFIPVLDQNGKYIGAVSAFTYISNLGKHLPHPNLLNNTGYVVLFDDNGDVLYHFDPALVGKNRSSAELQNYTGNNQALNEAFGNAAAGKVTKEKVPYTARGQNRIGEFRPIPVGTNHNFIILTSLPN